MADELDPRLETLLRTALRAEADTLPFTLRTVALERRLAERARRRSRRWVAFVAAAVVVGVGLTAGLLSLGRLNAPVATTPSPTAANPALGGLPSYEQLGSVIGSPASVLVRGEGVGTSPATEVVLGEVAGQVDVKVTIACDATVVGVRVTAQGATLLDGPLTCTGAGFASRLSLAGIAGNAPVARLAVIAPPGVAWRLIAGTGEVAPPTASPGDCVPIRQANQTRTLSLVAVNRGLGGFDGVVARSDFGDAPPSDDPGAWQVTGQYFLYTTDTVRLDPGPRCAASLDVSVARVADVQAALASGSSPVTLDLPPVVPTPGARTFDLPALPTGEFEIRVRISWFTGSDKVATDLLFYGVQVEVPPSPHPEPAVSCGTPDAAATTPPLLTLYQDGVAVGTGTYIAGGWNGTELPVASTLPEGEPITVASGTGLEIRVAGDVCALMWLVHYGPTTGSDGSGSGGILADQSNPTLDPAFARENHVALAALPSGDWDIRAGLQFATGGGTAAFHVRVGG